MFIHFDNWNMRLLCLTVSMLSSAVFVSCDQKKHRRAGGNSDAAAEAVAPDNADTLMDELIVLMNKFADTMISADWHVSCNQ